VGTITVGRVRAVLDQPRPRGLPPQAQNLVILTWALQTDRSFHLHGSSSTVEVTTDRIADELELRTQALPDEGLWTSAVKRAAELLGVVVPQHRTAQSLATLVQKVEEELKAVQPATLRYAQTLDAALPRAGVDPATSDRRKTVHAARDFVVALQGKKGEAMVRAVAEAAIATAMREALKQADVLERTLGRVQWELVASLRGLPAELFGARAEALLAVLQEALRRDEHVVGLQSAVERFNAEGRRDFGF
jgi:hypothetical protein